MQQLAQDVLDFWFGTEPKYWFVKDAAFDEAIRDQFGTLPERALAGELDAWSSSLKGMLALTLVCDQFSRNLFRGSPKAFAQDAIGLSLSYQMVAHPEFDGLSLSEKQFAIMPMMHSEGLEDQKACVDWFEKLGLDGLDYAKEHLYIIEKFGRFPHRNPVLGRETSAEEQAYLDEGGFKG